MKVLVSDNLADSGIEKLMSVPELEVEVNTSLTHNELLHVIREYDALVIRSGTKVTADIIEAADNLKVVARAGIGLDNVDVAAASKRGIVVMNTPEGNVITTAEHAVGLDADRRSNCERDRAILDAFRAWLAQPSARPTFTGFIGQVAALLAKFRSDVNEL